MPRHNHPAPPEITLTPAMIAKFRATVRGFYRANPRSFPWRETVAPYAILVSEIMLQQTQVERVRTKYGEFLAAFPDFAALASAPLQAVLSAWQGLGYNRRAVALNRCAQAVMERHGGGLPDDVTALETLPGIGPYTARAIAAFAFGRSTVFIETNIRTVFIHHFFRDREGVRDGEILPLVAATLDSAAPRDWYYALMDYGVMLKREHGNPGRKSAHHVRQSPFKGSNRELRSLILKEILANPGITEAKIIAALGADGEAVWNNLAQMEKEGFIYRKGNKLTIR